MSSSVGYTNGISGFNTAFASFATDPKRQERQVWHSEKKY